MTAPSWVPDQEIKPAPMPLLLVQSFVNTWDGDNRSDLLLDPAAARDWLTDAGLWSAKRAPDPAELYLARGVREGIRAMLAGSGAGPALRAVLVTSSRWASPRERRGPRQDPGRMERPVAGITWRGGGQEPRYRRTASTRRLSFSEAGRPSLPKMLATCFSTVPRVRTRAVAMPALDRPSAIRASTSRSRGVSGSRSPA